jgi:protein involved in polysaccharide export with SLBB domain
MVNKKNRMARCSLLSFILFSLALCGCAATEAQLERALRADNISGAHVHDLDDHYRLRCPDTVEVQIAAQPGMSGTRSIYPDGRIRLAEDVAVLVSGKTVPQAAGAIALAVGLPTRSVHVHVAGYNSQSIYLFGKSEKVQKVVPYRGPESVLDLLQRVGLADSGATLGDIQIVRAHVADGKPPEVFHVDLCAVLIRHDLQSNVRLEPFDRIYIGESCCSRLACCIPPVLQPLYRLAFGVK